MRTEGEPESTHATPCDPTRHVGGETHATGAAQAASEYRGSLPVEGSRRVVERMHAAPHQATQHIRAEHSRPPGQFTCSGGRQQVQLGSSSATPAGTSAGAAMCDTTVQLDLRVNRARTSMRSDMTGDKGYSGQTCHRQSCQAAGAPDWMPTRPTLRSSSCAARSGEGRPQAPPLGGSQSLPLRLLRRRRAATTLREAVGSRTPVPPPPCPVPPGLMFGSGRRGR